MNTIRRTTKIRPYTLALIGALAAFGTAHAQWDPKPGRPSPEFQRLDVDRDGYLSRGEAASLQDFGKAFVESDVDRDGRLDPDEFTSAQALHARTQAGRFVGDSVITAKVKAALARDLELGDALAVSVETHKGQVVLSGFVESDTLVRRAGEIAEAIEGVRGVKNSLLVKG